MGTKRHYSSLEVYQFIGGGSKHQIEMSYIQPGNPQQNAYIERYNRTVRYDWLNQYLFESIDEAHDFATHWMWIYNHEDPIWV